ncbi:MAG: hypothetical protein EOP62_07695 [Sphingomonadales bacterium]|nr:MAG: hypothetical protein EOP62_07695 [Sphingomonadales bacterium]
MKILFPIALCAASLALASCGGGESGGKPAVASATSTCAACHILDQSAGRRAGPGLHGIVGKAAGTQPGYAYSTAMKNSGIVWTPETLDAFLKSPQGTVPGTRMGAAGIGDPVLRKAIIDTLQAAK